MFYHNINVKIKIINHFSPDHAIFEPEQYNRIEFAKQNQLFILISIMSQFVTYPNNNLIFSFIL